MPNENPVQDAVSASLKYEINGEELNKTHKLELQKKFGLVPVSDEDITWYLTEVVQRG